ncbi:hypothetical protein MES5069_240002 [Mesorhizobium escarrei]|uniref:Uncharacterized protein n=1 Tax=Mesorhizobium escarrei TaxID=666018 RepID=A0ABM9DTI7_9HYPH|nr:hypothetical protein MES5069_240002 [Mesorhizobium escarrei]
MRWFPASWICEAMACITGTAVNGIPTQQATGLDQETLSVLGLFIQQEAICSDHCLRWRSGSD